MYNEELKKQFIKDDVTNKNFDKFMTRYFKTIEKYEEEYHKDLSNFNIQEIENYFVGLSTASYERCQNIKSQFIKYSQYCQQRNMIEDNQIHWQEVDGDFLKRTINVGKLEGQYVTRERLLKDLNQFDNASDIFVVLGIFEGLCGNNYKDFYHLSIDQFKIKNDKVFVELKDKTLEVSYKLYEIGLESSKCYERIPNVINSKKITKLNAEDPWIIKRAANSVTDTEAAHFHNFSLRLARLRRSYGLPYCNQMALINSGRLDFLHRIIGNEKKDVAKVLKENFDEITRIYGRIQVKGNLIEKYKELYESEE